MSSTDRALQAKEKGNTLFKHGKLTESIEFYTEAEKFDQKNPVYPSNLSAALYETGQYSSCIDAIFRSWTRAKTQSDTPDSAISLKLSTRLAKALNNGVQCGEITPDSALTLENATAMRELESVSTRIQSCSPSSENALAWAVWKRLRSGLNYHDDLVNEARVRLSRMPIFQLPPDPMLTYFQVGTDRILSLVDDWGANVPDPIDLETLPGDQLSQLSFLIAGAGDARHAFGTLIGLGLGYEALSLAKRKELKARVTLLDIHPASIAKALVLCMLVDRLVRGDLRGIPLLEMRTTMMYVYIGWVMPSYCETILLSTIEDLLGRLTEVSPRLPSWLHVDTNTLAPTIKILEFWFNHKSTTCAEALDDHEYFDPIARMADLPQSLSYMGIGDPFKKERTQVMETFDNLSDADLREIGVRIGAPDATLEEIRAYVEETKPMMIDQGIGRMRDQNPEWRLENEAVWYKKLKVYVPPSGLWSRHPGFECFRQVTEDAVSHKKLSNKLSKIEEDVHKSWKPNVTNLDGVTDGLVPLEVDVFLLIREMATFCAVHGIAPVGLSEDCPSFSLFSLFFAAVVVSVKSLGQHLKLEFICGEVNQELSKIRLQTDNRPSEFPRKFTRIWLSNIPDYTNGTLNMIVYILPALQSTPHAAVTANCMWNTPIWNSDDEFCFNYTMLRFEDLPRYLGCRVIRGEPVMGLLSLGTDPFPRPLSALAGKNELREWLIRLLLSTLWPGRPQRRPNTVRLPNTLVAFVQLLVELQNIGYPGHWMADFLQSMLANNIATDQLVYDGQLPRPVSDRLTRGSMHRIRLDPWQADLEGIVATSLRGIPFTIQIPRELSADANDVGTFKARVDGNILYQMRVVPSADPVLSLLFYKDAAELHPLHRSVEAFLQTIPNVLNGHTVPRPGSFQILTSQEFVDLRKNEIRWRMSRKRVEAMRRERWVMVAWRTDCLMTTTEPCPATMWTSLSSPV